MAWTPAEDPRSSASCEAKAIAVPVWLPKRTRTLGRRGIAATTAGDADGKAAAAAEEKWRRGAAARERARERAARRILPLEQGGATGEKEKARTARDVGRENAGALR